MAKYYFRLILLFASVVGIFAIIGSLLPRGYAFTSEISIAEKPESLFPEINSLKNWKNWSRQWNPAEIEGLEISYNGQPEGVGAAQSWSDIRGNGKLWITESTPNESIKYEMEFAGFPKMNSSIELLPDPATPSQTLVRWSSEGRLPGGPFYGYFGSFFSGQMKSQYDKSLEKLKLVSEGGSTTPETVDEVSPKEVSSNEAPPKN